MSRGRRLALASLLLLAPLLWSLGNENTALVKSLAAGVFAGFLLAAGEAGPVAAARRAPPAAALALLAAGGALLSPSPSFSFPAALTAVTCWLIAAAASGPLPPGFWLAWVPLSAAFPAAHAVAQRYGLDPTVWGLIVVEHFHGRVCATLGNPNFLAAFFAGTIPLTLAALARSLRRAPGSPVTALTAAVAAGSVAGLVFTGSKGGLLGLLAGTGAFALAVPRDTAAAALARAGLTPRRAFGGLAVAAALLLALAPPEVRHRLFLAEPAEAAGAGKIRIVRNESVRFRLLTWEQGLRMVREAPVFGFGPGRFQAVYPRYRKPEIIRMFGQHSYMTDHPENLTIEIAVEVGVVGLGAWIWLLAWIAAKARRRLAAGSEASRLTAAGAAAGLAALFVTNAFGVDLHYGATAVLGSALLGSLAAEPAPAAPSRVRRPAAGGLVPGLLLAAGSAALYGSDAALKRALEASTARSWDAAVTGYRRALRRVRGRNVMAGYFGASALMDRGRPEDLPEAERLFEEVRREAPDYVLVHYKRWLLYNRTGRPELARRALARQIELDPEAGLFYLERGREAVDREDWEGAREDFETAIRIEPDNPAGYQYLGNLEVVAERYDEALAAYARGLARFPDSPDLHYNAAVAAYKSGRTDLARQHAEAVLSLKPDHAQARVILSRLP